MEVGQRDSQDAIEDSHHEETWDTHTLSRRKASHAALTHSLSHTHNHAIHTHTVSLSRTHTDNVKHTQTHSTMLHSHTDNVIKLS